MGFTFCRGAEGGKIERAVATSIGKLQGCSHGRFHMERGKRGIKRKHALWEVGTQRDR
jgi:hypothetical protein